MKIKILKKERNVYVWLGILVVLILIESSVFGFLILTDKLQYNVKKSEEHTQPNFSKTLDFNNLDYNQIDEKMLKTAVHEAGHKVVALSVGRIINSVSAQTLINYNADGGISYYRLDDSIMKEKDYLDEVIINLSGRAAEVLLFQTDGGSKNCVDDAFQAKREIEKMFHKFPNNHYLQQRDGNKTKATKDVLDYCYNEIKKINQS
ncbi:hypothetical protein [Rice orange leaf phytoplasma]|uniref:hypothetical protein n=1 Tax=Rice orange leaf phytoplasma TaxID=146897 RepID=UPI0008F5792C|nr:hypothetical protein [Rice orange leaf phytoplasma]OIJ44951.1 hypothetical protein BHE82_00055 [Rice orange leaf phytoplasma]